MPRRRSFDGCRCLITGASSGLGRSLAEHLARAGAHLLLTGRSAARLDELVRSLIAEGIPPDRLSTFPADLTDPDDRHLLFRTASDRFGALDLVVNSAGVGAYGPFETHGEADLRRVFELNVFALAETTRAAFPLLRRGRHPALVNLGSIVARRGLPGRSEYSASKFAVAGFSESLRAEWSLHGIDVLLVNPGFTATDFERNLVVNTAVYGTQHRRTMTPDHVSRAILRALRLGKNELTLSLGGRLLLLTNRLLPRFVDFGLARFLRSLYPSPPATVRLPHSALATRMRSIRSGD